MASVMVAPSVSVASRVSLAALPMANTANPGKPSGHSPDPHRFRALYPDRWHTFLHSHFRDHIHVAFAFGVSERTGRDWWEGKTGSQGWAVAYAAEIIPETINELTGAA